jgi:hypothetical protein
MFYRTSTESPSSRRSRPYAGTSRVSWLKRKIILLATVTLSVKEYVDAENVTHSDPDQTATGGIQGTTELRILDWSETTHEDHIFGNLKSRNRWVTDLKTSESGNSGLLHPYLTEYHVRASQSCN